MEQKQHIVPYKTFISVWALLILLTAATVVIAELHMGGASVIIPLIIASAKAGLVLWFFMHLKYESRLFKLMLLMPIATLTVILGLTFLDIWYR